MERYAWTARILEGKKEEYVLRKKFVLDEHELVHEMNCEQKAS